MSNSEEEEGGTAPIKTKKNVVIKNKSVLTSTPTQDHDTGQISENKMADEAAKQRRDILRRELTRMKERDENALLRHRAKKKEEERKAVEQMHREKIERGITVFPETAECKRSVRKVISEEEKLALDDKKQALERESSRMKTYIDQKFGISTLPKGEELVSLAADFYSNERMPNEHLPQHIRRELTSAEINDFRLVFDLFDVKNKGYITADDIKRAAGMLGFTAKKRIFKEMINDTPKDKKGRVTFISFLELVIRLQGDGPDPYEDIVQFFRLLDKGDKGYVTFSDIRHAADEMKVPLSNKAVREMMEDADRTGDGKISLEELTHIMGQTGTFRASVPASLYL